MLLNLKFIIVCLISIFFIGCDTSSISTNIEKLSGRNSKVYPKAKLSSKIFNEIDLDKPNFSNRSEEKNRIGKSL